MTLEERAERFVWHMQNYIRIAGMAFGSPQYYAAMRKLALSYFKEVWEEAGAVREQGKADDGGCTNQT